MLLIRSLITGIKTGSPNPHCQMQFCHFYLFIYFPFSRSYRKKHLVKPSLLSPPSKTYLYNLFIENTFSPFPSSPGFHWLFLRVSWHSVSHTRMVLGWKKFSQPEGQTPATTAGLCSNPVCCVCIMCSYVL